MAIHFKTVRIKFDSTKGKIQEESGTATFSQIIKSGNVALQGYFIEYTEADHSLYQIEISINNVKVEGSAINFTVDFLLRDKSGNIDDPFDGWVDVLAIAEY